MKVKKRNGNIVDFDKNKITNSVKKAFIEVDGELYSTTKSKCNSISTYIANLDKGCITVEEIQDIVEDLLMASKRKDVARKYIRYRYLHELSRDSYDTLMDTIKEKLSAKNIKNQNANVDEASFGGRIGEASDAVMREFALKYCMSDMSRNNHLNNEIYIHDLNAYAVGMHNCLTIPYDKLLKEGFNTRQTDVRPAQSINTAFQLVAVIAQVQSLSQFGGVSASHIDWTMIPYVRKSFYKHYKDGLMYIDNSYDFDMNVDDIDNTSITDNIYTKNKRVYEYALDMTTKECYQAVEGLYHNLNTLQSRSGNQLPFTSINYGTCTFPEGRMVTKAILDISIKGIGKLHRTSVFPCGIFQCMKGVNREPDSPNYDLFRLALQSTSKRLYPNYANVDWSVNAGYDKNDPKTYVSTININDLWC